MLKERYLTGAVANDLREKMVFIGGARQGGKTTFAENVSKTLFDWQTGIREDFYYDSSEVANEP